VKQIYELIACLDGAKFAVFVRGFNDGFGWGLGLITAIVLWLHFVGLQL
jgi:hypothetical protein